MVEKQRCPRCGRIVESGFCPHCDMETTDRGVIRRHKKTQNKKAKSALEFTIEKANRAKKEQEDIFVKRNEGLEEFQKDLAFTQITDYQKQTVGDALAERDAKSLQPVFNENKELEVNEVATKLNEESNQVVKNNIEQDDIVPLPFSLNQAKTTEREAEVSFTQKQEQVASKQESEDSNDETEVVEEKVATEVETKDKVSKETVDEISETPVIEKKHEANEDMIESEHDGPFEIGFDFTKFKANVKQYRFWILGVVVVIAGMCVLISINNSHNAKIAEERKVQTDINSFYVNNDAKKGYLAKTVDDSSLKSVEKEINTLSKTNKAKAEKYRRQIADMKRDQDLVNKINELYLSVKIQGSQVLNPALKEDVEVNLTKIKDPQNDLEKAINRSIDDAKSQKDQQEKAKNAVEKVYNNNQVVTTATKQDYIDAKKAVDAVKNINFKKNYSEAIRQAGMYFGKE